MNIKNDWMNECIRDSNNKMFFFLFSCLLTTIWIATCCQFIHISFLSLYIQIKIWGKRGFEEDKMTIYVQLHSFNYHLIFKTWIVINQWILVCLISLVFLYSLRCLNLFEVICHRYNLLGTPLIANGVSYLVSNYIDEKLIVLISPPILWNREYPLVFLSLVTCFVC